MATLEDIVAASKFLSEDTASITADSGSKPKENQDGASEVRNGDGVSAADAVVSERKMEIEAAVECTAAADAVVRERKMEIESAVECTSAAVSEQNMEIKTTVESTSSADAAVSERMMEIETAVGSTSAADAVASEWRKENETAVKSTSAADAAVSEQNMEIETAVCSTFAADGVVSERNVQIETVAEAAAAVSERNVEIEAVVEPTSAANAAVSERNVEIETVVESAPAADAVVSEQNVEIDPVVESTYDDKKEKLGTIRLSPVFYNSSSVGVNGVDVGVGVDADDSKEELVSGENNEFLKESFTENGVGKSTDYMDVDGHDGEEGNNDELNDSANVFHAGDIVWAKIKSHPWWPGQIYDLKDVSNFAMELQMEGRLLVAFFGDGTCSWCLPSQLVPFKDYFSEMSKDSNSKSFQSAVDCALREVGRLVESEMTCKCASAGMRTDLARPFVENAGVKDGARVPDIDTAHLSIRKFEPEEVIERLMQSAKTVSVDSALDLSIMRSWLSAFHYSNGGHQLPVAKTFHIEGLEDKNKNEDDSGNDFSKPIPVLFATEDEMWPSSPAVGSVENMVSHSRKQKSVAELMGEKENKKPRSRKGGSIKEVADSETSLSSLKKTTKKKDGEAGSTGASSTGKSGRKRKVEEILESPKLTNAETRGLGAAEGVNGRPLLRKPKGIGVAIAENVKEDVEIVSSPRERKKSKYLSPPYTNVALARRTGISSPRTEPQIEHDKIGKITHHQVGERQKEPISENSSKGKLSNGRLDASEDEMKKDKEEVSFRVSDVDVPVNEFLSGMELASRDPLYLIKKGGLLEKVCAFASALRSSINLHGENYEIYCQGKAVGEQKSWYSQLGNGGSQTKAKSSTSKKAASPPKQTEDDLASDLGTIMQELTFTSAIVDKFLGKFSFEDKRSLKGAMKRLMEEVETVSEKVRVMGEKAKAEAAV